MPNLDQSGDGDGVVPPDIVRNAAISIGEDEKIPLPGTEQR